MKSISAIATAMNSVAVNKIIPLLYKFENREEVYYYQQILVDGGYKLRHSTLENADVISSAFYVEDFYFELRPGVRHHIAVDTMCDMVGCERDDLEGILITNSKAILDEIAQM